MSLKNIFPGILLCFIIAVPSWVLGNSFSLVGGPVFGILLGILITIFFPTLLAKNIFGSQYTFQEGVGYTTKKLLQYAIILLGFGLNLYTIFTVGGQSLSVIFFTLLAAFLTAYLIGKLLKLEGIITTLIAVGTAICGGSAIAAIAPIIRAKDEDIVHSISTIFLFNVIAVFVFPTLGHFLHLGDIGFGMWAGTAINDTSSVVAAATSWSASAGNNTALTVATIVKLTRTLMIVPIAIVLASFMIHVNKKELSEKHEFHFSKVFPWFILGFIAASVITTLFPIVSSASYLLVSFGKFIIIMAMVAIGLKTNLKILLRSGVKPITLGFLCWFVVAGVSLLVQMYIKIW